MKMRRVAPALALAGVLALAPTVAMADTYPPDEVEGSTSLPGTVATASESFTVSIPAQEGDEVTLTIRNPNVPSSAIQIAGEASKTKTAVDNNGVTFTVTLTQPGTFSLLGTVNGDVVLNEAITVETAATPGGDGTRVEAGGAVNVIGSEAIFLGVGAVLLAGIGTAALVSARRKQNTSA